MTTQFEDLMDLEHDITQLLRNDDEEDNFQDPLQFGVFTPMHFEYIDIQEAPIQQPNEPETPGQAQNLTDFIPTISNLKIPDQQPPQQIFNTPPQRHISKPKAKPKINKPKTISKKTTGEIAEKRKFKKPKIRSVLVKRCVNESCSHGQYFQTIEEAVDNHFNGDFQVLKNGSSYCPCGSTIQYLYEDKWYKSASLSSKIKKNNQ